MFIVPALMALLFEGAVGLNEVIFPAVLAGAFELSQGNRRGVCPYGRAPSIVSRALGVNKGNSRAGGVRRQRLGRIKKVVVDVGVDMGAEQMPFTEYLLFPSIAKGSLSVGNVPVLNGLLYYRGTVVANLGYDTNILKAGKGVVY